MTMLYLDTETRSRCDLKTRGSYNYAMDASTELLCLSYAFDDEDVQTWVPGQPFPQRVADHFASGGQIRCHNASFDRLILWYVVCPDFNVPTPRLTSFYCTAAQARANCAPGSLEDVGRFAGASMKKDHRGAQLIRLLSVPQADGTFREDAALMQEMIDYCAQDVRAMRAISQAMRDLSAEELLDYHTNERINDRGLLVDVPLCHAAVRYSDDEMEDIQRRVVEVTGGAIKSVRSPKMREWVLERVGPEALKLMVVYKDDVKKYSIDKSVRANLLAMDDPEQVPPDVAEVIQCADDLWASSVAKFSRLASLADEEDHRVRGAFVFAGGSATGRASSYGAQVHNFPRACAEDPEAVRASMVRGHAIVPQFGERITDVLKSMLRPSIMAPKGRVLVVYDWSAIEGRVHPWLADSPLGEDKLDVFRSNRDPYKVNAAATFGVAYDDVTKDQRQVGKVQELALGFLGGPGAFDAFGKVYGLRMSEAEVQAAVNGWRRANPWAAQHGQQLEAAIHAAMRRRGQESRGARIAYLFDGQSLWYALPSGRVLCYPNARYDDEGNVTYTKAAWKPKADATEWPRARLWRGLACENVVQATANDLLRHALRRLDAEGFDVIGHVHDEIIVECDAVDADRVSARMHEIMCEAPEWAQGLPLAAEGDVTVRYAK